MSGDDRQNELAREHKERQARRAAEENAKGRRNTFIGAGVAVVLVAGGIVAATTLFGGKAENVSAASTPSPSASASTSSEPEPSFTPKTGPISCAYTKDTQDVPKKFVGFPPKKPSAATMKIKTMTVRTNHGDIVIEVDPKMTPCTINSMAFLAKKNFFDGTKCHRLVVPENSGVGLLQCGDPKAKADGKNATDGQGTAGYVFGDEAAGAMPYTRGVVFLTQPTDSQGQNSSQFAISTTNENAQLDPAYSVLGMVTSGMELIDKVAAGGFIVNQDDVTGDGGSTAPKIPIIIKDVVLSAK
ncbi:peptidylprolyl isomerase [Nonomuraea typhae]|uniref:Peptidylprolyl isomerase n=1 Tax=Nonomuraea typhae TaxID=2603600 RepID=A0ABW7ZBK7_9ACTN